MRNYFKLAKEYIIYLSNVCIDSAFSFLKDDCYTKASTIAFYTLQSIVPLLAFAIGIAKGFGFEEYLETQVKEAVEQKEIINYAIEFAHSLLKQIAGSVVVGSGILLLLWTSLNLLGYIEITFNSIWKIKISRTLFQRIKDFLIILIICPIVFVASSAMTVYFREGITNLKSYYYLERISYFLLFLFKLTPILLATLLFFILYILVPNNRIRVWPRLIAAIIAGIAFQIWQIIFIELQVKLFNYSVVYGTFAALPLFLMWLQVNWLIILIGAEIAATLENKVFFIPSSEENMININKKELGVFILYNCLKSFYTHSQPLTKSQISKEFKLASESSNIIFEILEKNNILIPLENQAGETCYLPLFNPDYLTLKSALDIFDENNSKDIVIEKSEKLSIFLNLLNNLEQAANSSEANLKLKNLCEELP